MAYTFQESKDEVARIVKYFAGNRPAFLLPAYKEAHARQELIDPLFAALNWDVSNRQHAAPEYREVVVEDSLDIQGQKKAPDYAFRRGKDRVFFGEAKKPGVDLKNTTGPAYQLRRYAWSAKLPLSVLTDFEEFAVYDCRTRPNEKDKASIARVNYLTFQEYPDRWQEVWDVFSRDAVWGGSFDQYALEGQGRRGKSEVDTEFLKEIEGWRLSLAQNIALRNPKLTLDELTDAVQRIIDRIIFLRMAEDRGIEEYGRLENVSKQGNIYKGLLGAWRQADAKYNSGLFDFTKGGDQVTQNLTVDDKALKAILADLYFPKSPYEFSVMPTEVLGNVYEQFLGKVIRLTSSHQAKVEEKPEVKKAGGVFYTPAYIVDYIVRQTLGPAVASKSPTELKGFRVLDPSCGSGSFLLGAYTFLLDYYRDWYVQHEPQKYKKAIAQFDQSWQLTLPERKRILTEHIFGVDIDRQAVEVTKLSLSLKVLEGLRQLALFDERALPHLDANIKCGNSLIGPDQFTDQLWEPEPDTLRRVNPFDWKAEFPEATRKGGFDCIVGNPPYIRIQTLKEWAPLEVEAYKDEYAVAGSGNYDIYVVFVEQGLRLLNSHGRLGYILPHKFFNAKYGAGLRGLIAQGQHLEKVVHFGDQQVFAGASTYTCLMFLSKAKSQQCHVTKVPDLQLWRTRGEATEGYVPAQSITDSDWNFAVGAGAALFDRLQEIPLKLEHVTDRIFQGIKTGADKVYIVEEIERTAKRVRVYSPQQDAQYWLEADLLHSLVKGGDSKRYSLATTNRLILFPYSTVGGDKTTLISEKTLRHSFPLIWSYLSDNKSVLEEREDGKMKGRDWYAYSRSQALDVMPLPKVFTPDIAPVASYSLDDTGALFFTGGVAGGYGILVAEPYSREFILGLLNSRLLDWILRQVATSMRGGWYSFESRFIKGLPICEVPDTDKDSLAKRDKIISSVVQILGWNKQLAGRHSNSERDQLRKLIRSAESRIDALVYELYGLSADEIEVVESQSMNSR